MTNVRGKTGDVCEKDKRVSDEESRPFLSLEGGFGRSGHFCGSGRNHCLGVYLLAAVVLLSLVVFGLEVRRSGHGEAVRLELDALRRDVEMLKHRRQEDAVLRDLADFEDAVYSEEDGDEEDDGGEEETDDADEEDVAATDDHHARHLNLDRARRQVPVLARAYGVANKTEGLRLYESLVANREEAPMGTTETPVKQYHRVSPVWPSKQQRKKYRAPAENPRSTVAPSAIISRSSRVMQTDKDPSRRLTRQEETKKSHAGEILVRVYQEQRAAPESTITSVDLSDVEPTRQRRRKNKPAHKNLSSLEGVEDRPPVTTRHRLFPAAHFNGDTSRYTQAHEHYDGNGRLRHPDGVFTDWSPSKWVQQLGMDKHFKYADGAVNIRDTGLYLVYAQIHYLDEHDINGYRVYVNEDAMLQCTTMTHTTGHERVKKSNTCFTAAAIFLTENDRLSLSDIGGLRYSLFEPAKSFFGLIKLGSVNIK